MVPLFCLSANDVAALQIYLDVVATHVRLTAKRQGWNSPSPGSGYKLQAERGLHLNDDETKQGKPGNEVQSEGRLPSNWVGFG